MQPQRVLITGGLGQVGSYICERLVKQGHIVTILDNISSTFNPYPPEANFVKGDIRDTGLVNILAHQADMWYTAPPRYPSPGRWRIRCSTRRITLLVH